MDSLFFNKLNGVHDLSLPDWGPYSKRYIGVSHIPDVKSGLRFDLSVFPGFYRRKVFVPNVLFENSYHPWEASPNLEYFSFRHELEWKDQVYTDISYSEIDSSSRLIRIECVNNSQNNENLALHFMASINFPPIKEYSPYTPIYPAIISLPEGVIWFDALDYQDLQFKIIRPTDNLVADGKMRGEIRDNGFVNGSGIGLDFGKDQGDFVSYKINSDSNLKNAFLLIRYRQEKGGHANFSLSGICNQKHTFEKEGFGIDTVRLGDLQKGEYLLKFLSEGNSAIDLDGFILVESKLADKIAIEQKKWNPVPQIITGPINNSLLLKYDNVNQYYGLLWKYDLFEIREWYGRDLADYFKQMANEHVMMKFSGEGEGHYTNVFMKPIVLKPKSTKTIFGVVCYGTKDEVENKLLAIDKAQSQYETIFNNAHKKVVYKPVNKDGKKYQFSIERMQATIASNVVYPVYTQKEYIRHSAPGRWWDCLYTWDSGFLGLGMLQSDTLRAIENLNAYLQEPGAQSAFIHHGSPVPVQHYLYSELLSYTQSKELVKYFYPRLKQYHEFLSGRLGSSTTRQLKSGLLKTWDYFYNSGGWDDYPPQKYTHDKALEGTVSPVINTAQAIRTAKILKMSAKYLGLENDVKEFDDDIKTFSDALQKYSWDEKSGYFGYVVHDTKGIPLNILKYNENTNYDMGMDGAYPLIAGICTEDQKTKLIDALKSDKKIWTPVGLSAVDQSAPYYKIDGYWNGTVWMSHQWFFWKTMLDLGESDFAFKIATTALEVWKREVEASYNCMEHFLIETGRGAGWHEFGGLSSPVVVWYSAYFCQGTFNAGFDTWIENKKFNPDNSQFSADLSFQSNNKKSSIVVCMNPNYKYSAKWNGKEISYKTISDGTLSIEFNLSDTKNGKIEIKKR
ncbi:MAG: trehalase family glycosidase [Melioribacteraceae bacterium]